MKSKYVETPCIYCNGEGVERELCHNCNGSGEGNYDGSKCMICLGEGEIIDICDYCNGRGYDIKEV